MTPGSVTIHAIRPASATAAGDAALLSAEETRRAASFRFPEDAAHWISCRAALRRILAGLTGVAADELRFEAGPHGKPRLTGCGSEVHFNLSHCRDLALVATGINGPLGIDVEPIDRAGGLAGCEKTFCHPDEIAELPEGADRSLRLLEIWTAKEAILKASGTGFSVAPEALALDFTDLPAPGLRHDAAGAAAGLTVRRLRHPLLANHLAMLAAPECITRIEWAGNPASTDPLDCGKIPCDRHPD